MANEVLNDAIFSSLGENTHLVCRERLGREMGELLKTTGRGEEELSMLRGNERFDSQQGFEEMSNRLRRAERSGVGGERL